MCNRYTRDLSYFVRKAMNLWEKLCSWDVILKTLSKANEICYYIEISPASYFITYCKKHSQMKIDIISGFFKSLLKIFSDSSFLGLKSYLVTLTSDTWLVLWKKPILIIKQILTQNLMCVFFNLLLTNTDFDWFFVPLMLVTISSKLKIPWKENASIFLK